MALRITDECINCGACEAECPNMAIYEPATHWKMSEGTSIEGMFKFINGKTDDASEEQIPIDDDIYFIVPEKCTECKGFYDEPQCAVVCPVDCCIIDEENEETQEELLEKQAKLHSN